MNRKNIFLCLAIILVMGLFFPQPGSAQTTAKKLNIAVAQEPDSIDATTDSFGVNGIVLRNIQEFLIDKDYNGKLTPGLASSWKVSPDGKTIEFTLRKGVKFHNGDPLTAKDVEFTYARAQKVNRRMAVTMKNFNKIEVLDDYRIRFLLKTPDVTLIPNRFGVMIACKSYYDRVGEDKFMRAPVGTGPYKFVRYEDGQYMDIERFEDYWGKKPPVREARIYFVREDTTRMAKLQVGEVDLVQAVPYTMVKMIESSPNLKTLRLEMNYPTRGVIFSTWNPNKPWHDKRVRLAMAYAIDVDSIVKNVCFGIPNHCPWVAPGEVGYDPMVKSYPYDPKRAKQLLAEAGYPNGFEFNLYWDMGGRVPMSSEVVQAVASYFEAVGIRTKLEGLENEAFNAASKAGKKPTSDYVGYTSGGLTGSPDPTYGAFSYFSCEGASSVYCNPEYDKILFEAMSTVDDAKRGELVKRLVRIMREEVPAISIFDNVGVFGMQKNINFVPTKDRLDAVLVKDITVK